MKSLLKTALTFIALMTGLILSLGIVGATGVWLITSASPSAEARGDACAQLETLYGHSSADPIPGLHDALASEDLDGLARYYNLCWRGDEGRARLNAVQTRQLILESRQCSALKAQGEF